jgi:hypothetical protein
MVEDMRSFGYSRIACMKTGARLGATALAWSLASIHAPAQGAELSTPSIQATVERGTLTAIQRSPSAPNMLRSAVRVEITPGTEAPIAEDVITPEAFTSSGRSAAAERSSEAQGLSWRHEWQVSGGTLTIKTTFKNLTPDRRCVGINWRFAFVGADYEPFFSASFLTAQWPASGVSWYSYLAGHEDAHRLNIPLWSIYSTGRDVGVTVAADLATPILPFAVRAERLSDEVDLTVDRPQIRLEPHGSNCVTLYVALHEGDWRGALSWLRDRWPEQFFVDPHFEKYQNQMYSGVSTTADWRFGHSSNLERLLAERLPRDSGTVDYRIFPWWGLHFPYEEPFLISVDTKWHYWKKHPDAPGHPGNDADYKQILSFLNSIKMTDELQAKIRQESGGVAPDYWDYETFTQDKVRKKVKDRVERGIKSIQYLDVSEVWKPWAREHLRDSLFRPDSYTVGGAIGQLESTTAIALPGSSWERALLDQARNVLEHYPQMTGVFCDQVYYDLSDFTHDDGISIARDGKPFARQHWALARVMRKIKKLMAAQKKIVIINQAWNSIEIGSIGDLMLCEGGGRGLIRLLETLKFFGIGNRLSFDQVPFEIEAQDCLRYGWYMNLWTDPGDYQSDSRFTRLRFCRLYYPLFELLKGRTWVLEPHCLVLPEGMDGNLFRRPDGGIVAAVVTPNASSASPWTRTNVPLTVRVKDAASVKAAYVVTADLLGPRKIDFKRRGSEIVVHIPRHRSASAVLLATGGRLLSTPKFAVAPDNEVELCLDNFSSEPWQWRGKITLGESGVERSVTVAPGVSKIIKLSARDMPRKDGIATFAVRSDTRGAIPAIDPDKAPTPSSTFEMVVEPAVAPLLGVPPATVFCRDRDRPWEMNLFTKSRVDLMQGEQRDFQVAFKNHTAREVTLAPRFSVKGAVVMASPQKMIVPAGVTKTAAVTLRADAPGAGHLVISAQAPGGQVEARLPFNVNASAPLAGAAAKVKNVRVAVDVFYTGSGNPDVTLNGVKVGGLFDAWAPHPFSWYAAGTRFPLGDAAASAVGSANEVRFAVPGSLLLKVRNLALVVNYEDGRTAVLRADPQVQSTPADSGAAEGRLIPRGQPMVWQCAAGD